jgi:hypothetical protein
MSAAVLVEAIVSRAAQAVPRQLGKVDALWPPKFLGPCWLLAVEGQCRGFPA